MEILSSKNRQNLLHYLQQIKSPLSEWVLAEIRMTVTESDLTVAKIAQLTYSLFNTKAGKIYVCNDREILVLMHWGKANGADTVGNTITAKLPEKSCTIRVQEATVEGVTTLKLLIGQREEASSDAIPADARVARKENIIMVADDDMYMRMLVKKGAQSIATVHEVSNGDEVMEAYKQHMPDILFLDIHLPDRDGTILLHDILAVDHAAYIVMLSADSSQENVQLTVSKGAKGFLTKPFTKERLLEYIQKCPTIF